MSNAAPSRSVILLVDDNPHDVVLIRLAFRKAGIIDPIKLVKDGKEAMAYLEGTGFYADRQLNPFPTLVLLDLQMPQTSGFDVLAWIRGRDDWRGLQVVVMTGFKDTESINRAYQLGANSFLVKPNKFSDLVRMMEGLKANARPTVIHRDLELTSLPGQFSTSSPHAEGGGASHGCHPASC